MHSMVEGARAPSVGPAPSVGFAATSPAAQGRNEHVINACVGVMA